MLKPQCLSSLGQPDAVNTTSLQSTDNGLVQHVINIKASFYASVLLDFNSSLPLRGVDQQPPSLQGH